MQVQAGRRMQQEQGSRARAAAAAAAIVVGATKRASRRPSTSPALAPVRVAVLQLGWEHQGQQMGWHAAEMFCRSFWTTTLADDRGACSKRRMGHQSRQSACVGQVRGIDGKRALVMHMMQRCSKVACKWDVGTQTSKEGEQQQRSSPAKGERSIAGTANVV